MIDEAGEDGRRQSMLRRSPMFLSSCQARMDGLGSSKRVAVGKMAQRCVSYNGHA
jgi:hypothetical protein